MKKNPEEIQEQSEKQSAEQSESTKKTPQRLISDLIDLDEGKERPQSLTVNQDDATKILNLLNASEKSEAADEKKYRFVAPSADPTKEEQEHLLKTEKDQSETSQTRLFERNTRIMDLDEESKRRSTYLESVFDHPEQFNAEDVEKALKNVNALYHLMHHYGHKKHPKITAIDIAKLVFATVMAAGSLVLYWERTYHYSKGDLKQIIFFESSVNIANFFLAMFASLGTFNAFISQLPPNLRKKINEHATKNKLLYAIRLASLGLLSIVGALPFAVATEGGFLFQAIVLATNAVMNFYGYNNVIAEHVSIVYRNLTRSPKIKAYHRLLDGYTHAITEMTKYVAKSKAGVPSVLNNKSGKTFEEFMVELGKFAEEINVQPQTETSWKHKLFKRIIPGILGGGTVIGGMCGYILGTYQDLGDRWVQDDRINIPATILLLLPFNYLAAAFGVKTFQDIADFIADLPNLLSKKGDLPLAARLYFGRTVALCTILGVFAIFSYATSVDLVETSPYFSNEPSNVPHAGMLACCMGLFKSLAGAGASIFNLYGNEKLGLSAIEGGARYFGDPAHKEKANWVNNMLEAVEAVRRHMSREEFLNGVRKICEIDNHILTPAQKRKLFALQPDENLVDLLQKAEGTWYEPKEENSRPMSEMSQYKFFSESAKRTYKNANEGTKLLIKDAIKTAPADTINNIVKGYEKVEEPRAERMLNLQEEREPKPQEEEVPKSQEQLPLMEEEKNSQGNEKKSKRCSIM